MTYTPGPWEKCGGATPHYCAINSQKGYIIFGLADHLVDKEKGKPIKAPDMWEQQANARLIAAAPELLEALEDVIGRFTEAFPASETYEPIIAARAAIKKAKGE